MERDAATFFKATRLWLADVMQQRSKTQDQVRLELGLMRRLKIECLLEHDQ